MYCPKCGQEIISDELRFCPRCGLALTGVAELMAIDGLSAQKETRPTGLQIFRRKEYRLGAQILFFSIIAMPVAVILSVIFDSPGPLAIPFLLFVAALAKISYTFLFGKKPTALEGQTRKGMPYPKAAMLEEPPSYTSPIDIPGRATTNELVQPPSVTEKTTNLLKENS